MKIKRICYFGIYNPKFSRSKIYMDGLRQNGIEILECRSDKKGIAKYIDLWKKHKIIKEDYDVMIVGYPGGQIVTPFAKIISRKKVVLDALCSMYEAEIISRGKYGFLLGRAVKIWLIDFFAYLFADKIFVETNAQKLFFSSNFFVKAEKLVRIFTGADPNIFYPDKNIKKKNVFTVVFRGKFLPEAGVEVIIETAKILKKNDVNFIIIGSGFLEKRIKDKIKKYYLNNLLLVDKELEPNEMRNIMLSCHVSLGQFAQHERLERTIPHKAFESMALGLPYITLNQKAVNELFTDNVNCLMINTPNSYFLAKAIQHLQKDVIFREKIAGGGHELFTKKLTPRILAKQIIDQISL